MMKKYIIVLVCLLVTITGLLMLYHFKSTKIYGTVIILNGPSVSGKSSIQKEFQYAMMPDLWIKLGIDNLFDKPMPDITLKNMSFWQTKNPIRWVETTKDVQQNSIITLFTGPQGEKVAYAMNSAIVAYAHEGCNVIVDYIAYKKEWLDDLRKKLNGINTYWVKVNIPLSVLEEREIARGTSPKGHARSHYHFVHWDIVYDLEVDSATQSATNIAHNIKNFILAKNR